MDRRIIICFLVVIVASAYATQDKMRSDIAKGKPHVSGTKHPMLLNT